MVNYSEPSTAQKREIRKELEKINIKEISSGNGIIPTDLAEKTLLYCYGIGEDKFYSLGEAEITTLFANAFIKLFTKPEEQKKR